MNRSCRKCVTPLTADNTYGNNSGNICKICHREYVKQYSAKRRKVKLEYMKLHRRKSAAKLKLEVLTHYGQAKCAICGFDDIRALSIDHIAGGGCKHRKELGLMSQGSGGGGEKFYRWLKKNEYPKGYQVLCLNHQFIKEAINRSHQDDSPQLSPDLAT